MRARGGASPATALAFALALALAGCRRREASPEGGAGPRASEVASATPAGGVRPASTGDVPAGPPLGDDERRGLSGRIVFVSERDGNREAYALDPASLAELRLTESPIDEYPAGASPDGREVLLATADERSGGHVEQLARVPLAGGATTFFGPKSARVRNPSWSPDGRSITFESDAASFADLYGMRPDGSALRRLTRGGQAGNYAPALSPDGKTIAFVSSRDGDPEIYATDAEGARSRRLTAFHAEDWAPLWSPGGDRLAFVSSREGAEHVFLMAPSGADQRRLTAGRAPADAERAPARPPGPGVDEGEVAWAPSGRRIAFRARQPDGKTTLRAFDLDEGRVSDLTEGAFHDGAPAWSPDGRHLAFVSDRDGDVELYVMRADGSGKTRLTHAPGADWLPRWVAAPAKGAVGPGPAQGSRGGKT